MMSMTPDGPCDWPYTACDLCDDLSPGEPDAEAVAQAAYLLWAATGKVYGPCPVTVLPCNQAWCGICGDRLRDCGCANVPEIRLDGPVASVVDVIIDGATVDPAAYRVDDWEWLVRLDGDTWPTNTDPTDPDAFRVTYNLGIEPPAGAAAATGELACEIAKAWCGDKTCRLPSNVRSVTRSGVRIDIEPGEFGLFLVDRWVAAANTPIVAGAVHSPDIPVIRRITWEAGSPGSP